ncbi:5-formyltetrahydrofolate cyclo-ligase [Halioxenophilus aromaticivorans]|uniref:5-formyltetrahydrofolate cyclo-ligase n=1 Tax=Halioxenophilus aromaticivorans TaxID=1306992 RepID=A0AAV3U551_9ALTE
MISSDLEQSKRRIRADKKRARRQLAPSQQKRASQQLCKRIASSLTFITAQRVALYWPMGGEISPLPLLKHPTARHKQWYLPVIDGENMQFFRLKPGDRLQHNPFGIAEPEHRQVLPIAGWQLDMVIVPLVAFDPQRNRLGMGGGFYDRYFALRPGVIKRPILMGVAHECQRAEKLPLEPWDVPLQNIATDQRWY